MQYFYHEMNSYDLLEFRAVRLVHSGSPILRKKLEIINGTDFVRIRLTILKCHS